MLSPFKLARHCWLPSRSIFGKRTRASINRTSHPHSKGVRSVGEIEKERELEKGHAAPAVLGRYQNVILSKQELTELQSDFPTVCQEYIERLSEYMASTGRTYKSHVATIRRWIADDRRKAAPPARDRDYSVKDGDTV